MRKCIVEPSKRSLKAERKAKYKRTEEGSPVHSFQTVIKDLATISKNFIRFNIPGSEPFEKITRPTPFQEIILNLLKVSI